VDFINPVGKISLGRSVFQPVALQGKEEEQKPTAIRILCFDGKVVVTYILEAASSQDLAVWLKAFALCGRTYTA
jgi:hypothetical protein